MVPTPAAENLLGSWEPPPRNLLGMQIPTKLEIPGMGAGIYALTSPLGGSEASARLRTSKLSHLKIETLQTKVKMLNVNTSELFSLTIISYIFWGGRNGLFKQILKVVNLCMAMTINCSF